MQKSKTETLIQKYLSHQLNEQELEELKLWIEEDASHRESCEVTFTPPCKQPT